MVTHRLPRVGTGTELLGARNCLGGALLRGGPPSALTHQVSGSSVTAAVV